MGSQVSVSEQDRKTIVMVGVTGAGKSTTCNLITGTRAFDEHDGFESSTMEVVHCDAVRADLPIRVIDTMGFLNTTQDTQEERESKFLKFADVAPFGVDLFVLTEKYGRWTESNERHWKIFKELAGPDALKHTILLFTHINNKELQALAGNFPAGLQAVVEEVAAVVGVDNKRFPRPAWADLQRTVQEVLLGNEGERYMNDCLVKAKQRRQDLRERIDKLCDAHKKEILQNMYRGLHNGSEHYDDILNAVKRAEAGESLGLKNKKQQAPCCCIGLRQ